MSLPQFEDVTSSRLVIRVVPTRGELRGRLGRVAALYLVLAGVIAYGLLEAGSRWGKVGVSLPVAGAVFLGLFLVLWIVARLSGPSELVIDRGAGTLSSARPGRTRPGRTMSLAGVRGVRVEAASGGGRFSKRLWLDFEGGRSVLCLALDGRLSAREDEERCGKRVEEIASRLRAFLSGLETGE